MKGDKDIQVTEADKDFRTEAVIFTQYGWTLLHLAVWYMNAEMIKRLLDFGFDVNHKDIVRDKKHEDTPLHIAAFQKNKEVYSMLVELGAKEDARNKVRTT